MTIRNKLFIRMVWPIAIDKFWFEKNFLSMFWILGQLPPAACHLLFNFDHQTKPNFSSDFTAWHGCRHALSGQAQCRLRSRKGVADLSKIRDEASRSIPRIGWNQEAKNLREVANYREVENRRLSLALFLSLILFDFWVWRIFDLRNVSTFDLENSINSTCQLRLFICSRSLPHLPRICAHLPGTDRMWILHFLSPSPFFWNPRPASKHTSACRYSSLRAVGVALVTVPDKSEAATREVATEPVTATLSSILRSCSYRLTGSSAADDQMSWSCMRKPSVSCWENCLIDGLAGWKTAHANGIWSLFANWDACHCTSSFM